jgi:hypothetical protein
VERVFRRGFFFSVFKTDALSSDLFSLVAFGQPGRFSLSKWEIIDENDALDEREGFELSNFF